MELIQEFAPWIWLIIFVITTLITLKVKDIDALWFSLGSVITIIISIIFKKLDLLYQLLIFIVITIVPLLTLSKLIKSRHKKEKIQEASNTLIGQKVLIVEDCNEFTKGSATLNEQVWVTICQSGHSVKKGDEAIIVAIENKKLIIKQAE